jgi:hypothetical protein
LLAFEVEQSMKFYWPFKFLSNPHQTLIIPLLLWKVASVDTGQLLVSTCRPLVAAVETPDALRGLIVQIFYYAIWGWFLLLPLACRIGNTSYYPIALKASHATVGYWREQHRQPIGNKECEETMCNRFWLVRELEKFLSQPTAIGAAFRRKKGIGKCLVWVSQEIQKPVKNARKVF